MATKEKPGLRINKDRPVLQQSPASATGNDVWGIESINESYPQRTNLYWKGQLENPNNPISVKKNLEV